MSKTNVKKRYWSAIVYPDSAPSNWRELLTETGLPVAISPLHEFDSTPVGEQKKAHWHIILCFAGPTTFNAVKSITDRLNSPIPQALESVRGMYRYFTHKDNPEKFQYDESGISSLNGFDIQDYSELTHSETLQLKRRVFEIIHEQDILEYDELLTYLYENDLTSEWDVASCQTILFNTVISSRRNSRRSD